VKEFLKSPAIYQSYERMYGGTLCFVKKNKQSLAFGVICRI